MTNPQILRGLTTVSFWAADLEAAKKWYTELLGLAPYFERSGPDGRLAYIEFRLGDYQHELGLIDRNYTPKGTSAGPGGYHVQSSLPGGSGDNPKSIMKMMNTYVILLRGINVGGKNKVPMAGLIKCLEELGFSHVSTYLASGNVILKSDKRLDEIKAQIEEALPKRFRLDNELIKVLVLTRPQLQAIIDNKPEDFGEQPEKYHSDAIFLIDIDAAQAMPVFDPARESTRSGQVRGWSTHNGSALNGPKADLVKGCVATNTSPIRT